MKSLAGITVYIMMNRQAAGGRNFVQTSNPLTFNSPDVFDDINIIPPTPRPEISRNLLPSFSELTNNSAHTGK